MHIGTSALKIKCYLQTNLFTFKVSILLHIRKCKMVKAKLGFFVIFVGVIFCVIVWTILLLSARPRFYSQDSLTRKILSLEDLVLR